MRFLPTFFKFFIALLLVASVVPAFSKSVLHPPGKTKKGAINWLTFEQAVAQSKKEPRKIFIDVYTDWCGWCRKMEKSTFTDPVLADYVNKNFYAVRLDAESQEPITLDGKTFNYNQQKRAHELAFILLQGQLSFPTTVYLDENLKILAPVPGYLDVPAFRDIITFFGDNHYKKLTFPQYTANLKTAKKAN
ncbi:thioredoxin family protein [Adhaeribacter pallidiroseus]|uniref:Protein-disulfide reductase n=1 Tax=Adhaeribacter pallidiroseus TaxID=2072847 RepID=A0A369QFA4_9BACT|nr:DUF255 domain-containing protein [Adhaeribacter pallidiroseus]RDC63591.1 Protein-disulfide reductase [Adhaeribacter pallidiroseus]